MKVIIIILISFLINIGLYADVDNKNKKKFEANFSYEELQGTWIKQDCLIFKASMNKVDIGEKKYQSLKFSNKYYIEYASDDEHLYNKKHKIYNYNDFVLKGSYTYNQWLVFHANSKKVYFGISKITEKTKIKKVIEGYTIADFQVGDMILTLYSSKTKEIVYRLQYRKLQTKD